MIGWGTHMELEAFVNWVGMTTREALSSATSLAAEALGVQDDVGSIAPGKSADFIVLDANPLDDISNTRTDFAGYLHGDQLDRPALKAKWRQPVDASQVRTDSEAAMRSHHVNSHRRCRGIVFVPPSHLVRRPPTRSFSKT